MNYFIQPMQYSKINDIYFDGIYKLPKLYIQFMKVITMFQKRGKHDLQMYKKQAPDKDVKRLKRTQTLYTVNTYIYELFPNYMNLCTDLTSYISSRDIYSYGHPLLVTLYISQLEKTARNQAIHKYLRRINILHCIYICKQLTEETLSLLIYEFLESRRKKYVQYGNSSRTIYNLMIIRDDEYNEAKIRQYATFDTIVDFIIKYHTCSKEFMISHKSFITNHKLITLINSESSNSESHINDNLHDELFDNVD